VGESFNRAFEWILEAEGVDADDPDDLGGRTRFGISQRFHPNINVADLTLDEARQIYLEEYWQPIRGDELPELLGIVVFDGAVQHDPVDAARFLQQALHARLKTNGVIGPKTLAAATAAARHPKTLKETIVRYLAIRTAYYTRRVALRPKDEKHFNGWICRLFRLQAWVLALERREGDAGAQGGDGPRPSPLAATGPTSPSRRSTRPTEDR
jgi:lysozyme family protein